MESAPHRNRTPKLQRKKITTGGKRYCVLCKHKENQVLENGLKITLHRIPGRKSKSEVARKKAWLRGLKLHRPDLPITDSTRVCILHFENHKYEHGFSVPVTFNLEKQYKQKRSRRALAAIFNNEKPAENEMYTATPLYLDHSQGNECDTAECMTMNEQHYEPEMFSDTVNSCATVEVSTSSAKPHYVIVEKQKHKEHGYTLSPSKETKGVNAETQTSTATMRPEDIENDDEKTRFYTGFPTYLTFMLFFETLLKHGAGKLTYWEGQKRSLGDRSYNSENVGKPGRKRKLRPIEEFYMVCVRLRLGLLQEHLKDAFDVSVMTVSRVMNTWINFMYDHMKALIPWPTKDQIMANLPKCFSQMPQVRIVIDATEFFCEKPSSLTSQNLTWSEYKHHNTFKVLVGVAPNGLVTFISSVWGGHTSDRHITQKDGHLFIPRLEPGDIILADKGFTVADLLPPYIGLNMPPFISKSRQMSKGEFFKTQQIASSRIVVEMKMEQIKNFRVLQTVLPLSEAHLAEQMIVICTAMTNLYEPLLK